jgi:cytidylate kinase
MKLRDAFPNKLVKKERDVVFERQACGFFFGGHFILLVAGSTGMITLQAIQQIANHCEKEEHMPLITISQDFGSGGYQVAKRVAETLHLELYDDERLREKALEFGVQTEHLKGLEEKEPGLFDRLMGRKPEIYLDMLENVVYKIARQGEGVIIGHGSQILLKDFGCALHVRIYAPQESRINNMVSEEKISPEAAEKIIFKKDQEFKGFFRYAFQKEFNDPGLYDLIINTEKISTQTAAEYIINLARSDDVKACSLSALETMERRALERKIHAKLIEEGIVLNTITIEVREPGVAFVFGIARNDDERKIITEAVNSIPEVSKANLSIIKMAL